jgi:hypothetical protein
MKVKKKGSRELARLSTSNIVSGPRLSRSSSNPIAEDTSTQELPKAFMPEPPLQLAEPLPFVVDLWRTAMNEDFRDQCGFSSCGTVLEIRGPRVFFSTIVPQVVV